MRKWNIGLGFYQNLSTADAVLKELNRSGFRRLAYIHHTREGDLIVNKVYPVHILAGAIIALLAIVALFIFSEYFGIFNFAVNSILMAITALLVIGGTCFARYFSVIDSDIVNRFKNRVVIDEVLVIVQVKTRKVGTALRILRQVESGHPVSFLLRSDIFGEEKNVELTKEPLTMEQLRQHAVEVAGSLQKTVLKQTYRQPLLKRLKRSEQILQFLRHDVAEGENIEQTMTISAEWLLDNMYVIEGSIEEVQRNLPKKYYKELPQILGGPLSGLPRIYAIAIELVNSTAGRLSRESITEFLMSYQTIHPLTIGELWAFPLLLRLRLIEWVQFLAIQVDKRMHEGELASFWGNRLLHAARREPARLPYFFADLAREQPSPSFHFAEELLDHLFDEEAVLPLTRKWFEERFALPIPDILHQEQMHEMAEQVAFSNCIISLITLSQLSWPEIFEIVSPVDAVLRTEPANVYLEMDFITRNYYRKAIETLARRSHHLELEIAERVVQLANEGSSDVEKHVGYYLIDSGRLRLEASLGYKPPFSQSIRRGITSHPSVSYLGGIGFITILLETGLFYFSLKSGVSPIQTTFFSILSLLPFSELSIQLMNLLLTHILPPSVLSKMSFEKKIPEECKTLVVVPTMLSSHESIQEDLYRLEIRYLANADPSVHFGLFCDFADAPQQHVKEDADLLEEAVKGIEALKNKYSASKFFLFHRQRVWSKSENAWIGWERKRGKLEYLNRFLMGEIAPENILRVGEAEALKRVRYVITLDSDTQLPKNQARELIEILSHPLNRPCLSGDGRSVLRGYTIIQPRVSTDFPHGNASLFSRIFSDPSAVDPYTQAISNVYQDLTGEGTYNGKGIYDVAAFHRILTSRFPERHLLSHDLIEGVYVRVGFAGNVCLFDLHPEDYLTWANRAHRWMRGDWQIIDWLFPYVPQGNGQQEKNPLSLINRWKIFDNLRRALMPPSIVLLLVCAWVISPIAGLFIGLATIVLFNAPIFLIVGKLLNLSFPRTKWSWHEMNLVALRGVIITTLLPHESLSSLDAMLRVAYRRLVSQRGLLQWTASGYGGHSSFHNHQRFLLRLGFGSLFAVLTFITVYYVNPKELITALPFCFLWTIAPLVVRTIDMPDNTKKDRDLTDSDREFLRQLARKTWRYFDDFVGPQTHWLPPDNYQTALKIEIAPRTSPTNIGLWLLAVLSAYDLKYITCDSVIDKILASKEQLKKLERYEGHFLNWYNIQSLEPLYPRYISTVDSGNLLACMWTLQQGIYDMVVSPLLPASSLEGIKDTCRILIKENAKNPKALVLEEMISASAKDHPALILTLKDALKVVKNLIVEEANERPQIVYWLTQIEKQLDDWISISTRYFTWAAILTELSQDQISTIDSQASIWRDQALALNPSLKMMAKEEFPSSFDKLIESSQRPDLPPEIKAWGIKFKEALSTAKWLAGEKLAQAQELVTDFKVMADEVNLKFLYNRDRKLFAIGYNIDDRKLDTSYYDLLASEARIASLVAIARDEVPVEHWWALGRSYTKVKGRRVLLSWGGTMFEYLMPLLLNKYFPDFLLGEACNSIVACQIEYGKKRGIPWGISEAAFSAIDAHKTYQYRSFGIPGAGLKRGLEEDLVVSPYSSALALAVDPISAIANLKKLAEKSHINLFGAYGYYESIDFTRKRGPSGERGVIIYAYMAHHQGMILAAVNNVLNNDILPNRFHSDPRICGVESLLYEHIPFSPPVKVNRFMRETTMTRLEPFSQNPIMGIVGTPQSEIPKVNLLSNGNYSVMVTNAGGGYSRWRDIDITRWRADTTRDSWGTFYYIKDIESGEFWSTAYQPTLKKGEKYLASFKADKAEFRRRDNKIEMFTEIVVSPEDDAEIRLITLINHSETTRSLELTSYVELALAVHNTDRAHPCFNKFFIETEALPSLSGLLAFRRLRSPNDPPLWAAHVVSTSQPSLGEAQYETDRTRFIGRGRTLQHPLALDGNLSNTTGTVLDPIFSLRQRILLEPGRRVQFSFVTAIADNRAAAAALVEKYKDLAASHRSIELAWTYAQLELRHLRIHEEEAQLFQKLAGRILYPHAQLRSSVERLRSNRLGQSRLWAQGISGDLPIVVVSVGDVYDVDLVKQVLIAHAFWSLRGLKVDLIILNEEAPGYEHPLQEQLQRMIQAYAYRSQVEVPGGVFLRNGEQIPAEELLLILSVARAVLVAARGSLRQQLVSPMPATTYPKKLITNKKIKEETSSPLPFLELPYFNGLGGYSADGRTYVIYLGPHVNTPAPWINVISNPQFGTLVSEAGSGCTWYGNSQSNRLTPWSNDPLLNPITDTIYIRDEELGIFWTPTPEPIRELDAYRIHHGQGYTRFEHNSHGIEQDLLIFVPVDDNGGLPLRIQRLRLFNNSPHHRRLTVTAYSEWVLGVDKEDTQMHVVTEWDPESQALFAYNRYNTDYGDHLAFSHSIPPAASFSSDRTEFLGRNSSTADPAALKRKSLSGHTGAALDPCSALQVELKMDPGAHEEVVFILGYASDTAAARQLVLKCLNGGMIDQLFSDTQTWWDKVLGTIQVEVPDLAINFSLNRWLLYQNLSCRIWGRSAFYQSGGAYGFRDQLQDVMALVYSIPNAAREHIIKSASRQFVEGDVQHWWHPPSGGGVRTRISDDLLWLPFATAHYVRVTGDVSILEEKIPFLQAPPLTEDQHEAYLVPAISNEEASLLEHCRRAIYKSLGVGPHDLPLIGGGDWNDGMNLVGVKGKGESVWLAWFLIHVMQDFADLLSFSSQQESGEGFRVQAKRLAEVVEKSAWDGAWYRRAYFDDGTPLGSASNSECIIDSLTQSWAVICGLGDPVRAATALNSAEEYLVKAKDGLILLLTPPFDHSPANPGYIKGYPPGVRENGGQYTHGALWLAMAYARRGDGDKAAALLQMMHPYSHSRTLEETFHYKIEPYVAAADIYALAGQVGRGGWSWYTGSSGWMYRVWLEEILGFKLLGQILKIDCTIPKNWDGFKILYQYQTAFYDITVTNPHHVNRGSPSVTLDGVVLKTSEIPLINDGKRHKVEIILEKLADF
jgi:cyclic beta-1,2-glucan synthetase